MIINALLVFFFFSLAIFVHELGHFLVARRLGLKIEVFSIGFGPALWKRKVDGIVYKFCALPFGGYVALPQMDPSGAARTREGADPLPAVAPWKKIAVAFAGVTCNVILAFILAWVVYIAGKPADLKDLSSVIGYVETNSVLYAEGLRAGDRIVAINDRPVSNWEEILFQCAMEPQATIHATRGEQQLKVALKAASVEDAIKQLDGLSPMDPAVVEMAMPGSSAEKAGLRRGDEVVKLDGNHIYSRGQMIRAVNAAEGRELQLTVLREGAEVTMPVTPAYNKEEKRALIGIRFAPMIVHPKPLAQLKDAATGVLKIVRMLVTPKYSGRAFDALGGAPMIIFSYWQVLKVGLILAISFSVMLNINLAIINMLPIPVVDGGHVILSLVEWVQGRPAQPKIVSALWQSTAVLLILFMLTMTFRDFYRINKWTREAEIPAERVEPAPAPAVPTTP